MVLKEPAVPLSLLTCSGAKSKASSTSLPAPPRLIDGSSGVGPITAWGKWERKGEGKGFLWLFQKTPLHTEPGWKVIQPGCLLLRGGRKTQGKLENQALSLE